MRKALVLGDDTRSFLAVVRSLGRQGIEVHAAPVDFTAPALRSRYIAAVHVLPLWTGDGADWLAAVVALLRAQAFDIVIPCNEIWLLPLAHHRDVLAPLTRLAIPDDPAIAVLFDKHATRECAIALGVKVSPGRLLRPQEDAAAVVAEFGLPVMLKPRSSYTLGALDARGKVRAIRDAAELAAVLPGLPPEGYFLEAFFAGRGSGVSVLAGDGVIQQAFQHHRVRENRSGSGYYRVSAPVAPDLLAACAAMVAALDFSGLAMFEFRIDTGSGDWRLIEVNARPWGSLPLPVALGVDFPHRYFAWLTGGGVQPATEYPAGRYGRNLIPDAMELLEALRHAGGGAPMLMLRRLGEYGRNLTGREYQDTITGDDAAPGWLELRQAFAGAARRLAGRLPGGAAVRRWRDLRRLRAVLRARPGGPSVLFVCAGNICRSPYAQAAFAAGQPGLSVASAGTMMRVGRATPAAGIAAAVARGIDLRAHRAAHLTRAEAEAADLILVFDDVNRHAVATRHPGVAGRVFGLGALLGEGPIGDPIDGDQAVFAACYDRIDAGLQLLAEEIRRHR